MENKVKTMVRVYCDQSLNEILKFQGRFSDSKSDIINITLLSMQPIFSRHWRLASRQVCVA